MDNLLPTENIFAYPYFYETQKSATSSSIMNKHSVPSTTQPGPSLAELKEQATKAGKNLGPIMEKHLTNVYL
jgi:hypothetical protein